MTTLRLICASVLLALGALCALPLQRLAGAEPAVVFHVSPEGNDAWSGTRSAPSPDKTDGPFLTVLKARDAARAFRAAAAAPLSAPVVIRLRGGRHELEQTLLLEPADSGTAQSPLRFEAATGETPVLSGGRVLRGWSAEQADGRVRWSAEVPEAKGGAWRFRRLNVNGSARDVPRLPKSGFYTIKGLAGADPKGKYNTPANAFEFTPGEIRADWSNLGEIETVVLHFWVDTHLKIAAVEQDKNIVRFDRFSKRKFTDDHNDKRYARYYLLNVLEALSEPGEFYLDPRTGRATYLPRPGEVLEQFAPVAPKLEQLVKFAGDAKAQKTVEHIHFDGISFTDSTWIPQPKDAVDLQAASSLPGAIQFVNARNCSIQNARLALLGSYGVELREGCRDIHVLRCEMTDLSGGGVKIQGGTANAPEALHTTGTRIEDCHIHHCGQVFHSSVGVLLMHGSNSRIVHNHIHHLYYTGISAGWNWGYAKSATHSNTIEHNYIHHIGQKMLTDMGGIYTLGPSPGTTIRFNHIHDVDSWSYGGWGIYTDEGSSNILIENNLVYRTKTGGFHQHYGKENIVRNNIFALMAEDMIQNTRSEPHLGFTFERNILYSAGRPMLGKNWKGTNFKIDGNIYWDTAGAPQFPGGSFAEWQKKGHDTNSIVADPLFAAPERGDFTLKPESPALKAGFVPFDISSAGVRPAGAPAPEARQ